MAINWQQLLELAPLAFAKPGSVAGSALMRGYQRSLQRIQQEQLQQRGQARQDQQAARQDKLARMQMENMQADNARGDKQLQMQQAQQALNRVAAYRREDMGQLGELAKTPELALAPEATPLSAQNDLTVQRLGAQMDYGVPPGTPQGPLPNMTRAVSTRDKRLAQQIIDRLDKATLDKDSPYGGYKGKPELEELLVQFKDGQTKKIKELRAMAGGLLLGPDGQPAPPMPTGRTVTPGSFEEYVDAPPDRQRLIEGARKKYLQADDRPRESSARDVGSAREAAYQAVLSGSSVTAAARALRQAGLDPEIELGRIRREVEEDVRRVESQLPSDRYTEDRTDPAVHDARMKRARDILRGTGGAGATGGGAPPASAGASTMSRAELRAVAKRLGVTEAEAERQAGERGLAVVP